MAYKTNYLSQRNKIVRRTCKGTAEIKNRSARARRSHFDANPRQSKKVRVAAATLLRLDQLHQCDHGGNGGRTNILCTYPGLLAPSGWTDYGSGTDAGLVTINSNWAIAEN
jgi:hypothetical protein